MNRQPRAVSQTVTPTTTTIRPETDATQSRIHPRVCLRDPLAVGRVVSTKCLPSSSGSSAAPSRCAVDAEAPARREDAGVGCRARLRRPHPIVHIDYLAIGRAYQVHRGGAPNPHSHVRTLTAITSPESGSDRLARLPQPTN